MQTEEIESTEDIWVVFRDILNKFSCNLQRDLESEIKSELSELHSECYLKTPFLDFNKLTGGFGNSHLNILASRPAMGKTAFALNILEDVCFEQKLSAGFFSLDMRIEPIVKRLLCSQADVESDKVRNGYLSKNEIGRITRALNTMKESRLIIDCSVGLTIFDLVDCAKLMKEKFGIDFLVIDYLQLISMDGPFSSRASPYQDAAEIVRMLKYLAQDLQIPILCLSQLSRKVEERPGYRPILNDLPNTSALEEHADTVTFIRRRDYYDPNDKPGMAEIIIAKNRYGHVGCLNLCFIKEICQFRNYQPIATDNEFSFADL